jgi:hypothetical protein
MAVRIQLSFADQDAHFLERMRVEMNLSSREEVIKHALGILDWWWEERKAGSKLVIERGNEQHYVVFPFEVEPNSPTQE